MSFEIISGKQLKYKSKMNFIFYNNIVSLEKIPI